SLMDMATKFPTTARKFNMIKGVGAKKLETYGEIFMLTIRRFLDNTTMPISETRN
ncbi:MAG: superfamily II DNA helicase RecQ, partial [Planctomycetota bacterium]